MKRDNFSEIELREISEVLGYDVEIVFVDRSERRHEKNFIAELTE